MIPVYGKKCLSHKAVHNWFEKFSQKRSKVADNALPGRPVETAREANVQWVEQLVLVDTRITINTVVNALECSHGLAYSIMHDHLGSQRTEGSRKN
jgi:transposase